MFAELTTPSAAIRRLRDFIINAAATPPFQGGEYARPVIHSHVLTPWAML